ncbi:isocitrate lyase/PEP mutase family protein [Flavitalea flava]
MANRFDEFLALHHNDHPLLIGNVWDVPGAKVFERKKFKAIATSSAAVAEMLGYADGQEMSISDYLFIVKRIAPSVSIPFSVDIEAGYSDTPEAIKHWIARLYEMGVAGINMEDSTVKDGVRNIEPASVFAEKLKKIMNLLEDDHIHMFVNVRSDSFLLNLPHALEDALARIDLYQHTSVHGLFFPCITGLTDIEKITKRSILPVNVMCMTGLPDFAQLQQAGVKRISMGPFLHTGLYKVMENTVGDIVATGSFAGLFNDQRSFRPQVL